jgi:hypothetical protein
MRGRSWGTAAAASAVCLIIGSRASATVPPYLTEQGRLLDSTGAPVTGATSFVFSLYSAATGGTAIWTETQSLTLDSGFFTAQLGSVTKIPAGTFATAAGSSENLYLGIEVGTDPELSPRQPLTSVPYAFVADNAIGDITPHTVSVNGQTVINAAGAWTGATTGLQGPAGPAGAAGATGPAGPAGAAGNTGPAGPAGPAGNTGSPGAQGAQGAPGSPGAQGASGAPGPGGVMKTNLSGGVTLTALAGGSSQTFLNEFSITVPATATQCFVVANGAVCSGQPSGSAGVRLAYSAGNGAFGDYASGAGACWLSTIPTTSGCSSCASFAVIPVTGGGSYAFGCDLVMFSSTSGMTGACQASAVCF